jgi:hypothetical protein
MKYKIINNTFKLNKRDANFNKTLYFSYIDGFERKEISIKPSQLMYMEFNSLPISLRKLSLKGLVSIFQITDDVFYTELEKHNKIIMNNKIKNEENKKKSKPKETSNKTKTNTKPKETQKKSTKKESENTSED